MQTAVLYPVKRPLPMLVLQGRDAVVLVFCGESGHYYGILCRRENPVKYTDPDGRTTAFKEKIQAVGAWIKENHKAIGTIGVGLAMMAGGNLLKGTGVGGGTALSVASGGTLVAAGIAGGAAVYAAGQALEGAGAVTVAAGLAMLSVGKSDGSQGNSGNMKRLSDNEIEKRTGTDVHDVKETIRNQFKKEMKDSGFSKNFDIYENNGNVIIKANQGKAELNLNISLESLGTGPL